MFLETPWRFLEFPLIRVPPKEPRVVRVMRALRLLPSFAFWLGIAVAGEEKEMSLISSLDLKEGAPLSLLSPVHFLYLVFFLS